MSQVLVEAPRHRYFSVLGVLLDSSAQVLNQAQLELSVFTSEPLHFLCEVSDEETLSQLVEGLKSEFAGEKFAVRGVD